MSYEQSMKHFRNHRKDRFYQQCSGYFGDGEQKTAYPTPEQEAENSRASMKEIINRKNFFPVYIRQFSDSRWEIVSDTDLFGTRIETQEDLIKFAEEYA